MRSKMTLFATFVLSVAVSGLYSATMQAQDAPGKRWTDTFPVEEFSSTGANPYFILEPGYTVVLTGRDDGKSAHLTITVLNETKTVDGVETRVVEEREVLDGELVEVSRNYFAIGTRTNSVSTSGRT